MRPLLIFFVLGCGLFAVKRGLSVTHAAPQTLRMHVRQDANAHELERAVQRALLAEVGLKAGAPLRDPVIGERLTQSLSDPDRPLSGPALQKQAEQLGLWHEDAVIEARLALVGELRLRASIRTQAPTDDALLELRDAHKERYQRPERVSFTQVFLARARHAAELTRAATDLRARLVAEQIGPDGALFHTEASNLPTNISEASLSQVASRFGEEFAQALSRVTPGAWSTPLPSAFGAHLVWLTERRPAGLLDLSQARARLLFEYREQAVRKAVEQQLNALRADYILERVP